MNEPESSNEPDWEIQLTLSLTPNWLIHSLFNTANSVHTGWTSCVDPALVVADLLAADDRNGNYCRLVEQEFSEVEGESSSENEDGVWHDWAVEIRIGQVLVTGHWQIPVNTTPMEWEWCAREAEQAFEKACVLFGKRVRRGFVVEEPTSQTPPPKPKRH